jgi:hypothetical protein
VQPILTAGTQYWLIASTPGPDEVAAWNFNNIGDLGPIAFRTNLGAWTVGQDALRDAFRINGTVIPEPTSALLLLAGLGGIGFYWRTRA